MTVVGMTPDSIGLWKTTVTATATQIHSTRVAPNTIANVFSLGFRFKIKTSAESLVWRALTAAWFFRV
jgi:hypothetical protein